MIKWIVIALLGLIILGYLGFDVRKAIEAPTTQSNIEYAKNATIYVWNKYLEEPAKFVWNFFITYIWNTAVDNLQKIKDGDEVNYQKLPSPLPTK